MEYGVPEGPANTRVAAIIADAMMKTVGFGIMSTVGFFTSPTKADWINDSLYCLPHGWLDCQDNGFYLADYAK